MKKFFALITIFIITVSTLSCCTGTEIFFDGFESFSIFNTYTEIKLYREHDDAETKSKFSAAIEEMKTALEEVDNALSASKETSDIARFNAALPGETIAIGQIALDCFKTARSLFEVTYGKYNPAVYNLVDLWGFTARFNEAKNTLTMPYDRQEGLPSQKYIGAFTQLCFYFDDIVLDEENMTLTKPTFSVQVDGVEYGLKMDFGGIGKGYACDLFKDIAKKYGITRGYISIGTSSICFLESAQGGSVAVDMANPRAETFGNDFLTVQNVENSCISVSGDNQRRMKGTDYCHIIDPFTGYPTQTTLASVLVNGQNAAVCDAVTTALMLMSKEEAAVFCDSQVFDDLGLKRVVFAIDEDNKLFAATNDSDVQVVNDQVRLLTYDVYENSAIFSEQQNFSAVFAGAAALLCLVVVVLLLSKRNRALQVGNKQQTDFSKIKFFAKADILLYIVVVALIFGVFVGIFGGKSDDAPKFIEVYIDGAMVYRYDCDSAEGQIKNSRWADKIDQSTDGTTLTVKIFVDDQKVEYNTIQFGSFGARVVEATCSGKDCTKEICHISRAGQTAFCLPHKLKVVGIGEGNKEVV